MANRVPAVPGALGAVPLPKPNATMWTGFRQIDFTSFAIYFLFLCFNKSTIKSQQAVSAILEMLIRMIFKITFQSAAIKAAYLISAYYFTNTT